MSEQEQLTRETGEESGELPANRNPIVEPTPTEHLDAAADGLSAFNRILWEIAKTFGIITLILMLVFSLFMAWQIAQWGMTTL